MGHRHWPLTWLVGWHVRGRQLEQVHLWPPGWWAEGFGVEWEVLAVEPQPFAGALHALTVKVGKHALATHAVAEAAVVELAAA